MIRKTKKGSDSHKITNREFMPSSFWMHDIFSFFYIDVIYML